MSNIFFHECIAIQILMHGHGLAATGPTWLCMGIGADCATSRWPGRHSL